MRISAHKRHETVNKVLTPAVADQSRIVTHVLRMFDDEDPAIKRRIASKQF
jgi:hypothetical protein